MNKLIIGLLAVSAIAFASAPVNAGSRRVNNNSSNVDNAQVINQRNVTTGDHNTSVNDARQNHQNVRNNAAGSSANGQAISQECDTFGNSNACINRASQSNQQINQGQSARNNRPTRKRH